MIIVSSLFFSSNYTRGADNETSKSEIQKEIDELDQKIQEKQKYIDELKNQEGYYQKNIEQKRKEILTLKNQLSLLENSLHKKELGIKTLKTEIDKVNLEIENIGLQIKEKEDDIQAQKEKLAEIIRLIYLNDQKSLLEIFLTDNSLAEFFNQIKYSEDLHQGLQKTLDKIQVVKQGLTVQKNDLNTKKENLGDLKTNLETEKDKLTIQQKMKENILVQTKGVEEKFQSVLFEIQRQWNQANSEINTLEKTVREKLNKQKELGNNLWTGGKLSWPVPNKGITCSFHDPDYPFRKWIGEHPAIDIRAAQGTTIYAAAPGYVARAKNAGMGYSYIMIVHNDNISTVYGHVSKIFVKEDTFVSRGQAIGLSGGLPGTPGAGSFSLGPHLHFEVRLNGIPVNPLEYLQ